MEGGKESTEVKSEWLHANHAKGYPTVQSEGLHNVTVITNYNRLRFCNCYKDYTRGSVTSAATSYTFILSCCYTECLKTTLM